MLAELEALGVALRDLEDGHCGFTVCSEASLVSLVT